MNKRNRVVDVLTGSDEMSCYSMADWSLLIRQAAHSLLLGKVDAGLRNAGVPVAPAVHFEAARRVAQRQRQQVRFEVAKIQQALAGLDVPVVLLKGAAYVMAELPPADGRMFSDIDILVPKARLNEVEQAMMLHGWGGGHHDPYDERYYRDWMHELPPLMHAKRKTVVDVHHTILPETCRLKPDAAKLIASATPLPGYKNLYRLSDHDIVLHSAAHLFHDGELEHGLRDLVDMDALLRHFGEQENFWDELIERAAEMDLGRPLYYALHYVRRFLGTPVPDVAMKAAATLGKPPMIISSLMDALFGRALMPDHSSCDDAFTPLARWLLYIRSHYLRMPPHLLLPHLLRKAVKRRQGSVPLVAQQVEER